MFYALVFVDFVGRVVVEFQGSGLVRCADSLGGLLGGAKIAVNDSRGKPCRATDWRRSASKC
jgi:hypothetical protein